MIDRPRQFTCLGIYTRPAKALARFATTSLCIYLLFGCSAAITNPLTSATSGSLNSPYPITISPSSSQVTLGQTLQLTAFQNGIPVTGGTWKLAGGASNGSISSAGVYVAPEDMPPTDPVSVAFTLNNSTSQSTITILNPTPILIAAEPTALAQASTQVMFVGDGFTPDTELQVNGVLTPITYINGARITATINVPQGSTGLIPVTAITPSPGGGSSSSINLLIAPPQFQVSPAILAGGNVNLVVTGTSFSGSPVILLDGKKLPTTLVSSTTLSASGYLKPWKSGSVTVAVAPASGSTPTMQQSVPIAPTAVSYDTASRFATQAAFGPRHDIVEHIQQIGLTAFITEQMQQPIIHYSPAAPCCGPRLTFLQNAVTGNSLLRARVSSALQTFVVQQGLYVLPTLVPWQQKMETDAFGNFEQVLRDAASDTSMGLFLNLVNNPASSDPNVHPNQNFARELMQLFSMGDVMLNDDGTQQLDQNGMQIPSYDQTTVLNLSRVFTGWDCDHSPDPVMNAGGCNYANPLLATQSHDQGQKVLFGNITLPAGQDAATDRDMAIAAVFNQPNVPPFVSRILIQRLVKSQPSPAYVGRISAIFKNDGKGVRGNLAAVVQAILLDPEARSGDTTATSTDGFLQEPLLFTTFGMSMLGMNSTDGEPTYVPGELGEDFDYSATVFGYYSPSYVIPGTTINSPESQIFNNLSMVQRSQFWWGMIQGSVAGFERLPNYLYTTFTTVPDMLDAVNHLLYHGTMSSDQQAAILAYCNTMDPNNVTAQLDAVVFLAGNGDSYNVSH